MSYGYKTMPLNFGPNYAKIEIAEQKSHKGLATPSDERQ